MQIQTVKNSEDHRNMTDIRRESSRNSITHSCIDDEFLHTILNFFSESIDSSLIKRIKFGLLYSQCSFNVLSLVLYSEILLMPKNASYGLFDIEFIGNERVTQSSGFQSSDRQENILMDTFNYRENFFNLHIWVKQFREKSRK